VSEQSISSNRARTTVSWGLLDQIVSSGSTFLFVVVAARALSASDLGSVSVAFEFYLLGVFAARGVSGDPLTSRFSGLDVIGLRNPVRSAASTAIAIGALLGILLVAGSFFVEPTLRSVLIVVGVAMPGLTLQDYVRSALIVQGRVRSTFVNDCLWTFGQLPAMAAAIAIDSRPATVCAAWAATGCVVALIGLFQLHHTPARPQAVRSWLRENRDLWPFYLGDNLLYELSSLSLILIVSATAGLESMAGFRVAMTVYAPLSLIGRGVISVAVALLARNRDAPGEVRRNALIISLILTPLAIGWGLLTLLIPEQLGEAFFGKSWAEASPIVFLASFVCASGLFATGVSIGLRSLSAGRHTLSGRLIVSIGAAIAAGIGGALGATHGLFVALAVFFPIQIVVWTLLLVHAAGQAEAKIRLRESLNVE